MLTATVFRDSLLEGRFMILAPEKIGGSFPAQKSPLAILHNRQSDLGVKPFSFHHFPAHFLFSSVLLNRYDSLPVSMMCA